MAPYITYYFSLYLQKNRIESKTEQIYIAYRYEKNPMYMLFILFNVLKWSIFKNISWKIQTRGICSFHFQNRVPNGQIKLQNEFMKSSIFQISNSKFFLQIQDNSKKKEQHNRLCTRRHISNCTPQYRGFCKAISFFRSLF